MWVITRPETNLIYSNNKTGEQYKIVDVEVINATNNNDGEKMILYVDIAGRCFVRNRKEFEEKFTRNAVAE